MFVSLMALYLKKKKLGSFGWTSNFSFYYAHHISTIEGGMVCTNDKSAYNNLLMLRSHGMIREVKDLKFQSMFKKKYKDLNSQFIFNYPAYNLRNTEIGGVLGQSQIKRIDQNIQKRNKNFDYFLRGLDEEKFFKKFNTEGMSNYALVVILKNKDKKLFNSIVKKLNKNWIEFRIGSAGGGNQLRQPYLRKIFKNKYIDFKNAEYMHFYSLYIGNYPELKRKNIDFFLKVLNSSS